MTSNQGERHLNVVPMFTREVEPQTPVDKDTLDDLLTPALKDSLLDIHTRVWDVFDVGTVGEFIEEMRAIKQVVSQWPDGDA